MDFLAVAFLLTLVWAMVWTASSSLDHADAPYIKAIPTPECPSYLFDADLVSASCYPGEFHNIPSGFRA